MREKLCKDCGEPIEDQLSRKRICDACKLEREIEREEAREARRTSG